MRAAARSARSSVTRTPTRRAASARRASPRIARRRILSAALAAANERHVIFHARGGSIARGGSRIDSLVRTAPAGTVNGVLRLTEQGEVINQSYGLRPIAMRTLERAFHALALSLGGSATGMTRRRPSRCSSPRASPR